VPSYNQQPLEALEKGAPCKELAGMSLEEIREMAQAYIDSIPGGMRTAKPDLMSFNGHYFKINYDVPEEVTEGLLDLMEREAKYEEVPREYLKYEVEKPKE
jgi:hypothetical protein